MVMGCDDLAMNGVFPLEDFNRYVAVSVVECLPVVPHKAVAEVSKIGNL